MGLAPVALRLRLVLVVLMSVACDCDDREVVYRFCYGCALDDECLLVDVDVVAVVVAAADVVVDDESFGLA